MLQPSTARSAVLLFIFLSVSVFAYSQATCSSAVTLTTSIAFSATTGDLQGATNAAPTGACGGATSSTTNGVWYKFTATSSSATIIVNNLGSNLTASTTYVELLDGVCPSSFTSRACQDASTSLVYNALTVGTVYYVRVYVTGSTTSGGNPNRRGFDICIESSPNDDCGSAILLTS